MPAKKLDAEQLADAARLKAAWETWKDSQRADGLPFTQDYMADELKFKTQSAVSQYIGGRIPLNPDALKKFARLFGVSLASISPSIVARMQAQARDWLIVAKPEWKPPEISIAAGKKTPSKKRKR